MSKPGMPKGLRSSSSRVLVLVVGGGAAVLIGSSGRALLLDVDGDHGRSHTLHGVGEGKPRPESAPAGAFTALPSSGGGGEGPPACTPAWVV